MLDLIPKNIYQNLFKIDLNKKIDIQDNTYEGITCVGTFTFGHVNPPALDEMVRICKTGSLICLQSILEFMKNMDLTKRSKN